MYRKIKLINHHFIDKCTSIILKEVQTHTEKIFDKVEDIHSAVAIDKVNRLRIKCFEEINCLDWEREFLPSLTDCIHEYCGPDYMLQNKINLSIVMPNDENSVLSGHSDSWTGESPFQINFWIPLTDTYEKNGIFILNEEKSFDIFEKIKNGSDSNFVENLEDGDFVQVKFGEAVVFNPVLYHGSITNLTNKTRASLNFRAKNLFAPDLSEYFPDRNPFSYYKKIFYSKSTNLGIKYLSMLKSEKERL